jgi:hypothetical protein
MAARRTARGLSRDIFQADRNRHGPDSRGLIGWLGPDAVPSGKHTAVVASHRIRAGRAENIIAGLQAAFSDRTRRGHHPDQQPRRIAGAAGQINDRWRLKQVEHAVVRGCRGCCASGGYYGAVADRIYVTRRVSSAPSAWYSTASAQSARWRRRRAAVIRGREQGVSRPFSPLSPGTGSMRRDARRDSPQHKW